MSGTTGVQLPLYAYRYWRHQPAPAAVASHAENGTEPQKAQSLLTYVPGLSPGMLSGLAALYSQSPEFQAKSNELLVVLEKPVDLNEEAYQRLVAAYRKFADSTEKMMATTREMIQTLEDWLRRSPGRRSELQAAINSARDSLREMEQRLNEYNRFLNRASSEPAVSATSSGDAISYAAYIAQALPTPDGIEATQSVIDEILEEGLQAWAEEKRLEKLKEMIQDEVMGELGITTEDLEKMDEVVRNQVEQRIAEMVNERLEAALKQGGEPQRGDARPSFVIVV